MDDIKLFAQKLDTFIQAIRIYILDIKMEFGIEKCTLLVMKSGKRKITLKMKLPNQEKKNRTLEEMKITSTREYWKCTQSNEREFKEKFEKSTTEKRKTYSKPSSPVEISSKR